MLSEVKFTLNGKRIIYQGDPLRRLLDVIREDLGFTGTKEGCSEGECGACSVIKDGRLVTSCIIPIGACNEIQRRVSVLFLLSQKAELFSVVSVFLVWSWLHIIYWITTRILQKKR